MNSRRQLESHGPRHGRSLKFVLVNQRTPSEPSTCVACSRSLAAGYLRDVSTQRHYCDYDCYHRHQAASLLMPWLAAPRADPSSMPGYPGAFDLITAFAAASCWSSIAFAKVAVHLSELAAAESFGS